MILGYNLKYQLERLSYEFRAYLPTYRIPLASVFKPGCVVPVIILDGDARAITFMHWGYYAKGYTLVHEARAPRRSYPFARTDQLSNSRLYARSLELGNRCLVPASEFLHMKPSEPRRLYRGRATMEELFAFAGIWTLTPAGPGSEQGSFALLTAPSVPELASFGPRMPIMLAASSYRAWLHENMELGFAAKVGARMGLSVALD